MMREYLGHGVLDASSYRSYMEVPGRVDELVKLMRQDESSVTCAFVASNVEDLVARPDSHVISQISILRTVL